MNPLYLLPVIFAQSGKPVGVESLFGPLGELLNAMVNFVWWSIWAKGFAACFALIMVPLVIALTCTVVYILMTRKRNDG